MADYAGRILSAIGAGDPNFSKAGGGWTPGNPLLMLIGPSGNIARAPTPSGLEFQFYTGSINVEADHHLYNTWSMMASPIISWGGNELVFALRKDHGTSDFINLIAFCPYGATPRLGNIKDLPGNKAGGDGQEQFEIASYTFGDADCIVQDGRYYRRLNKLWVGSYHDTAGLAHIGDKCHYFFGTVSWASQSTINYYAAYPYNRQHIYKPAYYELGSVVGSGYAPLTVGISHTRATAGSTQTSYWGGGPYELNFDLAKLDPDSLDLVTHPVYHNGLIYIVKEHIIAATIPNVQTGFGALPLMREGVSDIQNPASSKYSTLTYWSESDTTPYGAKYKYPIKWKDGRILFLQNDGKIFEEVNGQIVQVVDITQVMTTTYSSGIFGGKMNIGVPNTATGDPGVDSYKCFGAKMGNRLHVFLNYNITSDGASRTGLFWATTEDLLSFTDRTNTLPNSGIVPPSGLTSTQYLGRISPFQFSGYENFHAVWPDGRPSGTTDCRPSGWNQKVGLNTQWSGSGIFHENDYSQTPDNWDVPMQYSTITHYLAPTYTVEPSGFTQGLVPTGVAFQGYRWQGVNGWHVHGWTEEDESKIHLIFTPESWTAANMRSSGVYNQNLYYVLHSSLQWEYKNQFMSKRIAWVEPTEMHEPSILLPSGSVNRAYPFEDRIKKVVFQPFRIYDWPRFKNVDIQVQYSTDQGTSWHNATRNATHSDSLTNVDTGSLAADPSGIMGKEYMFAWDYPTDVGNNTTVQWVQFRFRATGAD
jgi:hypothetical protein